MTGTVIATFVSTESKDSFVYNLGDLRCTLESKEFPDDTSIDTILQYGEDLTAADENVNWVFLSCHRNQNKRGDK